MAETITITGTQTHLNNGPGNSHVLNVDEFSMGVRDNTVQGMYDEPIADNVKWFVKCGRATVCIVELKPELRWIKWLASDSPALYGPEATHTERQLATPYVVLKVPFRDRRVLSRVEVFYRNKPLTSLDGKGGALCWPNLLNVSPEVYGCMAWFCTQHLKMSPIASGITAGLDSVVHHLWGGQFNRSSETHEGRSTFSKAAQDKIDPRVTDVDCWEAESRKNRNS